MTLDNALTLFRRLGVDVQTLSRQEFSNAYFALARRYHPDHNANTPDLMANINMARTCILRSYRWPEPSEAAFGQATRPSASNRRGSSPQPEQTSNGRPIFGKRIWPSYAPG